MLSPRAQQALFALPALRGLSAVDRRRIAELVDEIVLEKGEIVYRAGDDAHALYLVATGAVEALGPVDAIMRYGPGDIFGEAVLMPGERRVVTTRVALDARLVVLSRGALEQLFELYPSLHQRVSGVLMRRLKGAVRHALGAAHSRPGELVLLEGWRSEGERTAFVADLTAALERLLDRDVSILTIVSPTDLRPAVRAHRPDGVVAVDESAPGEARERIASELASHARRAPVVLIVIADSAANLGHELSRLADTVLLRIDGALPETAVVGSGRVVFVHDRRSGAGPAVSGNGILSLPIDEAGRGRAFGRLARHLTHRSIGLALGSGAAWGLAHIGVLDVLERADVPIDVIAGASMGAIVGGHYALGFSPAELEEMATSVRALGDLMRILPRILYLAVDFNVTRPGIFAGEHFQRVLESIGPIRGKTFADLEIPFRAIATDIATGARVEVCHGELSDALRASFSAPWIFSPFRIGEHVLIDGGMSDPVPAETARAMGADLVIGVNVVPPVYPQAQNPLEAALRALEWVNPLSFGNGDRLPSSFDVVVRTLQIMQHELGNVRSGEADLLIHPDLRNQWVLEFWAASAMIEEGRRAAEAALPAIRAKLSALCGRDGP